MNKPWVFIVSIFMLTPVLWIGAYLFYPKAIVGVVLVDQCRTEYGEIVTQGFNRYYGDYFDAKILPVRFNAAKVKTKRKAFLNSDFFTLGRPAQLMKEYGLDIVLFLTDHPLRDGDFMGLWGQADTRTGSVILTVKYWMNNPSKDIKLQHLALHETFHLLGYPHNKWDLSGIMQYALNTEAVELCPYYRAQLPIRMLTFEQGFGHPFQYAVLLTALMFSMILLPAYIAVELTFLRIFSIRKSSIKPTKSMAYLNVLLAFLLSITLNGFWYHLMIPVALLAFIHSIHYIYLKRCKNNDGEFVRMN